MVLGGKQWDRRFVTFRASRNNWLLYLIRSLAIYREYTFVIKLQARQNDE